MRILKITAFILTIIGALNWGLVGAFRLDLVGAIFGEMSMISRIVYILVGLAGLFSLFTTYSCASEDV